MSKEPNNIDRLVREKLDGFEMTPPPSVWKNTSASLLSGRKKLFFLWFAFGFAALAILGAGIYYFSLEKSSSEQLALENNIEQSKNLTKDEAIDGQNRRSSTNNSANVKDQTNAENEIELTTEKATDAGNDTSDEELNGGRNFSSINQNMTRKKIEAQNKRNDLKNQSKDGNSLKSTKTGAGSESGIDSSNDQNSDDLNDNLTDTGSKGANTEGNGNTTSANNDETTSNGERNSDDENITQSNSDNSNLPENYSSLATAPIRLFPTESAQLSLDELEEEDPNTLKAPFWKSISLEGSIGMSTFKNQASKSTTDSNLLTVLNNAANGQLGLDFRFGANYHFTDRISFQTGIHHNSLRENYNFTSEETTTYVYYDTVSFVVDSMFDTTYIIDPISYDSITTVSNSVQNSYKIFTLPFQFAWTQPISPRSALEFSLGGAISIFGKNTGSVIVDGSNSYVGSENGYHTTGMLSLGGSFKYLYRFGMHHSAYIEPWAQFGVTNQSLPALNYNSLRRRYGVRVGYRFNF